MNMMSENGDHGDGQSKPSRFVDKSMSRITTLSDRVYSPIPRMSRSEVGNFDRVDIHRFLRRILEDEYSFNESRSDNRFCVFFAHLLKAITTISLDERTSPFLSYSYAEELANLEVLLYEAIHCVNERFEILFDVAYNAEFFIINLLPNQESVFFYEAMVDAAQRYSSRQYGVMLSSFGQVLGFAQTRISEANDQYRKALDVLKPLGDSRDLAWLYNHIGYVWFEKGIFSKAQRISCHTGCMDGCRYVARQTKGQPKRYFELANDMLHRERTRLKQFGEADRPDLQSPCLRQEHILIDRTQASVLSCLGLLHSTLRNYEVAIKYHKEAISIRRKLFGLHAALGQGYNNLCIVYERAGHHQKALKNARKGLRVKERLVPHNSNTVLVSLLNVAHMTHNYEGSPTAALSVLDEAYNIRKVLGLKHNLTAVIWVYRGKIQLNLEKYNEAAESFRCAVDGFRQNEGNPRSLAEALRYLGTSLKNLGDLVEAERCLSQSVKLIKKIAKDNDKPCEDEEELKDTLRELTEVRGMVQSRMK